MAGSNAFEGSRDIVQRLMPALRRFSHALVGAQGVGVAARNGAVKNGVSKNDPADMLLDAALERLGVIGDRSEAVLKVALYGSIVATHRARQQSRDTDAAPFRTPVRGIVQAIDRLPLDQREVILLVVLEQFSYDQAATILGLPRSSVLARLVRARAAIASSADEATHHRPPYLRVVK